VNPPQVYRTMTLVLSFAALFPLPVMGRITSSVSVLIASGSQGASTTHQSLIGLEGIRSDTDTLGMQSTGENIVDGLSLSGMCKGRFQCCPQSRKYECGW